LKKGERCLLETTKFIKEDRLELKEGRLLSFHQKNILLKNVPLPDLNTLLQKEGCLPYVIAPLDLPIVPD
tara:strand:- start:130 stop:339 length:210 start_codon:yes stop_codon:yes gene_type:complete